MIQIQLSITKGFVDDAKAVVEEWQQGLDNILGHILVDVLNKRQPGIGLCSTQLFILVGFALVDQRGQNQIEFFRFEKKGYAFEMKKF